MKKIEAVVLASREKDILNALQKSGVGGLTVTPGKGRGKGPRNVQAGPGRYIERYNDVLTFFIVVEDSKVDEVVSAITEASHTGNLGDGKIFISTVDDVIDITTKQKGEMYI
ncbi:P-II family nitrogen regulator [Nitrosomonas supralitoralis]|uniref:Transcriptional regulator n=1 Tax=Nitrosomonas supralitoralis TaxID=2116706 RepID=A0A2P7NW24_9PROT|nr:P-II family nitrogen regulator [Nitrosomonas supralitoralis]PSJ17639.1 transcriptional regulator [Nitrosomonas supralitoralis]